MATPRDPYVERLIREGARRRKLDPAAVIAVALGEGGLRRGAIGDSGTSGGPFQLHRGGALPAGRSVAWASADEGINYALDRIAGVARGLTGPAAVSRIVTEFERPADPDTSVARALARYGRGDDNQQEAASAPAAAPTSAEPEAGGDLRRQMLLALLQARRAGNDRSQVLEMLAAPAGQQGAAAPAPPPPPTAGAPPNPSSNGSLDALLTRYGLADAITSGDRPGAVTRRGTRSFHAEPGRARDINPRSRDLPKLIAAIRANPRLVNEFFYDPLGWYVDNGELVRGRIGGHSDHAHVAR